MRRSARSSARLSHSPIPNENSQDEDEEEQEVRSIDASPLHVDDLNFKEESHPFVSSDSTNPVRSDQSENDNESRNSISVSMEQDEINSNRRKDEMSAEADAIDLICQVPNRVDPLIEISKCSPSGCGINSIPVEVNEDETLVNGESIDEGESDENKGVPHVASISMAQHEKLEDNYEQRLENYAACNAQNLDGSSWEECDTPFNNEMSLYKVETTNSTCHNDEDDIRLSFTEVKLEIYRECLRIYRGKGPERRFAKYWEQLGLYTSSAISLMPNIHSRLRSVSGVGSIDDFLNSFLISRRLRQLHNTLVLGKSLEQFLCFYDGFLFYILYIIL